MKKLTLSLLILLLIANACVSQAIQPSEDEAPFDKDSIQTGKADYNPNPQYAPEEQEQLVQGHNQFALELYKLLAATKENLVYSPYSLYQALAMVYAGARGETASQFEDVLHLTATNPQVHNLMNGLNLMLTRKNEALTEEEHAVLQVANAMWVQKDVELLPEYLDLLSENYAAGLRSLDFADAQNAAELINQWAAENTNEKITDIASPDMFNADVNLALTNAVYFKGSWLHPFDEMITSQENFTKLDGSVLEVPTMRKTETFIAFQNEAYQVVRLPYSGSDIVMDLVAPTDDNWNDFINNLSAESLHSYLSELQPRNVSLSLPKFRIETPNMDMIANLGELGLLDLFGMDANLSGINGKQDLYVSTLVQKAFIDVDENGTEAAATTLAVMMAKGMLSPEPLELRFDRPFLFVIRDTNTDTILFIGHVMQP